MSSRKRAETAAEPELPTQLTPAMLHPRHWVVWLGLGLLSLLSLLPHRLRDGLAWLVARVSFRPRAKRLRIAALNIRHCFPDKDETEVRHWLWQHYLAIVQIMLQLPLLWWGSEAAIRKRVELRNFSLIENARDQQRSIVTLVSHSVALEFLVVGLSIPLPMIGIFKPLGQPVADWLFLRTRSRFGNELYRRGRGLREMLKACRAGRAIGYMGDEDLGPDVSVFAPFFGQPKATLAMLPRIVAGADAAVFPVFGWYDASSGKVVIEVLPPLEGFPADTAEESARLINQGFECSISSAPAQLLWTLRYFKTTADGSANIYRQAILPDLD